MSVVLDHSREVVGRTDCQADEVLAPEARNAPQIWYATRAKSPKLRHLQRHREDKLEKRVEVAKMYMVL